MAASFGAVLAWQSPVELYPKTPWRESREFYPQGVASADPHADSVIVWTRRPPLNGKTAKNLTVEVAEDSGFNRIVARATASLSAETDFDSV
jgi:Phosphodiesterase/alkaline phosphatase D